LLPKTQGVDVATSAWAKNLGKKRCKPVNDLTRQYFKNIKSDPERFGKKEFTTAAPGRARKGRLERRGDDRRKRGDGGGVITNGREPKENRDNGCVKQGARRTLRTGNANKAP